MLLFLSNSVLSLVMFLHSFYVSISEINYNEKTHKLEISTKLFADDLEKALSQNYNQKTDLFNELTKASPWIAQYLKENFSIRVNNKNVELNFVGADKEDDAIWIYLESEKLRKLKALEVTNTNLQELYPSQKNLIKITVKGETESLKLTNEKPKGKVEF